MHINNQLPPPHFLSLVFLMVLSLAVCMSSVCLFVSCLFFVIIVVILVCLLYILITLFHWLLDMSFCLYLSFSLQHSYGQFVLFC